MIPFEGACSVRQFVPNKPNPVGLKNFVVAAQNGLLLDFEIYQGANTFDQIPESYRAGIGGNVVNHLCGNLAKGSHVFCDRYFTSIGLIH